MAFALAVSCTTPAERAAAELAGRIVPSYASAIKFKESPAEKEYYRIEPAGKTVLISGSDANALAAGLGRYLDDAGIDVSWYASEPVECPEVMPMPDSVVFCESLVPQRFFLNYCTFGYTMPWWQWTEWERFIDWMALHGINLPLAITGQEAVWQKVWRKFGLSDDEIRAYFTGPAHLPWHRMCNIDGVDGPLPQKWIDRQAALQKQILRRERGLGMKPVLPAFGGHVPLRLKELYPNARISDVSRWCRFPEQNRCHFLSPSDSLYGVIQKAFLKEQTKLFGTDHIYGFDLFNEVEAPCWEPDTLAAIGKNAYASVAAFDPQAQWLQMGWLFHNDRRHWTPSNVKAYLEAIPQGKVTILDYYTEHTPVWTITEKFYGQPYIFCYLGNFGGNTRLAGPFRTMSSRINDAYANGGDNMVGIGCTLEGFGVNRWFYEYTLSRAWNTGIKDDDWLSRLDRRHHSPDGFWKDMADSIYLRGSFSEGPLICDRPGTEGWHSWRVIHTTPYEPEVLERAFSRLLEHGGNSVIWRADVAEIGCQVLGNSFTRLRSDFVAACRAGKREEAAELGCRMMDVISRADALAGTHPEMRLDRWLSAAESWGDTPEEKAYYRFNAWHLITTWGYNQVLNDYANRLWNGLASDYYARRWQLFIDWMLQCLDSGEAFDQAAFDDKCWEMENEIVRSAGFPDSSQLTLMTYNVSSFSRHHDSLQDIAQLIREQGAGLVSLNELDSCNRRHNVYQLEMLASSLGYSGHFASAFPFAGGAYGNGVVSFLPVLCRESIQLPQLDGYEPRSVAVVETPSCVFASAHLDFKVSSSDQAAMINDWFSANYANYNKPVFLCGDMNASPSSATISELEKCWTRLSPTDVTFPTSGPAYPASGLPSLISGSSKTSGTTSRDPSEGKCIDYVFALNSAAPVEVVSARVVTSGCSDLSDHYPVVVSVRF